MLDSLGTIAIASTIAVVLGGALSTAGARPSRTVAAAAVAGAWVGLAVTVTATGVLNVPAVLGAMLAIPLVGTTVAALVSRTVRATLFALPVEVLVPLYAMRAIGVVILFLAAAGRLSGPFPYFAGIGDILTGLFALSAARVAANASPRDRRFIAWNAFGALDLVVAVVLGVTTQPGSPTQLLHVGVGSAAVTTLPWSLIPLTLVPAYLVGHAVLFARAFARVERTDGREPQAFGPAAHAQPST